MSGRYELVAGKIMIDGKQVWLEHFERLVYNYYLGVSMEDREPDEDFEELIRQVRAPKE